MLGVVFQDISSRDCLQYFVERDMLFDHFLLSVLGDTYVLLHDTSPQPAKDRGHLALVEDGTPASPDSSETAEKAYSK